MIPEGFQARHRFDVLGWLAELAKQGLTPVALIAVEGTDPVSRVGMAGVPEMSPAQLVALLEECVTFARQCLPIEHGRENAAPEGGAK